MEYYFNRYVKVVGWRRFNHVVNADNSEEAIEKAISDFIDEKQGEWDEDDIDEYGWDEDYPLNTSDEIWITDSDDETVELGVKVWDDIPLHIKRDEKIKLIFT